MQRGRGGYTIIEVMVVLAVGLVTFLAAVSLLAGKQGKTEFSQAMRDVQTQIQSVVNDVGVSNYPDAGSTECRIGPDNRPRLVNDASPTGTGTNTQCIFLGKAIQLDNSTDPPHKLNVYTIVGRTKDASNQTITDFNEANPSPIMGPPSDVNLTEDYTIPFSAAVLSAKEDQQPDRETDLMGFYNSLQPTGPAAQGSQNLLAKGYAGFDSQDATADVKAAIEDRMPGVTIVDSRRWTICFQSGTSDEKAELVVNISYSGVTTSLTYTDCS